MRICRLRTKSFITLAPVFWWDRGSTKANGRYSKHGLGQAFNSKLGSFAPLHSKCKACLPLVNCDTCAKRKILFLNEMKLYEIWPRPKGWVQKIFQTLPPNFVKGLYKNWFKFHPFFMIQTLIIKLKTLPRFSSVNLSFFLAFASNFFLSKHLNSSTQIGSEPYRYIL